MRVLVTGGAGYIGSHTVVLLQEAGHEVVIFDNLCNSHPEVLKRIEQITAQRPLFIEGDLLDPSSLDTVFTDNDIDAVIHLAGLKAVGESVEKPLLYYQNNVEGSLNLFQAMINHSCKRIVFSSSATVYGNPASVPICENATLSPTNPYGRNKMMVEEVLRDLHTSDHNWQISLLRYFNPVGAHSSGLIGEDPNGIPNNLLPYIAQVAVGKLPELKIFGCDYSTPDGTGVRDYIHVMDLSEAHLKALEGLNSAHGCVAYNIGTGHGYSVLEMIQAFGKAAKRDIPYSMAPRRSGDIAECYANPAFSNKRLGWKAKWGIEEMVRDHWNWQRNNPQGYQ